MLEEETTLTNNRLTGEFKEESVTSSPSNVSGGHVSFASVKSKFFKNDAVSDE